MVIKINEEYGKYETKNNTFVSKCQKVNHYSESLNTESKL